MVKHVLNAGDLKQYQNTLCFPDSTLTIEQEMVDAFLTLTGEQQWIHTDVHRSNTELPVNSTIIPGNLLIASVPRMLNETFQIENCSKCLLGGYGRIKFHAPALTNQSIKVEFTITRIKRIKNLTYVTFNCCFLSLKAGTILCTLSVDNLYYDS